MLPNNDKKQNSKGEKSAFGGSASGGEEESENEITKQMKDLEEEKKKSEEYLNNWKRCQADFINYKRHQSEIFDELVRSANQGLILEILPVYDTFTLAVKHIPENLKNEEWVKGMVQIKIQLENLLKNKGLEEIRSIGEKFDPEVHEAVELIESERPEGEILDEIQTGYELNGMVIRTAKVKVAKRKSE